MTKRRGRKQPSDPQEITRRRLERQAEQDSTARVTARDPASWGIASDIRKAPANREDVVAVADPSRRGKFVHARRSDAFSAISLSVDQERAAKRYCRDWSFRAGVRVEDPEYRPDRLEIVVDNSPGLAPGQRQTQVMIDAGGRIEAVHQAMGPGSARLLEGLVEPLVMRGEVRVWRVQVQLITGETERHAQAASVRAACENLHLAYEAIAAKKAEEARRGRSERPRFAGGGTAL